MNHDHPPQESRNSNLVFNWILIGFLVVAGYFLVMEHKAHLEGLLAFLPFLLLLACPLMHLFMHGGHGRGGHGSSEASNESAKEKEHGSRH